MKKRRDDWIDEDEYPDERDIDDLGDDSLTDFDRNTLGHLGNIHQPYWTRTRIFLAIIAFLLLLAILLTEILPLLQR